jgi:hypothetical protein
LWRTAGEARQQAGNRVIGDMQTAQQQLLHHLPVELHVFERRDGASAFIQGVDTAQGFSPVEMAESEERQALWEMVGRFIGQKSGPGEAVGVFHKLYDHILQAQATRDCYFYKGLPLVWLSDFYKILGYVATAHRFLMLALIEEAIRSCGTISPGLGEKGSGTYLRLVWPGLLSDKDFHRYAKQSFDLSQANGQESRYPEWVLQKLDTDWMTRRPSDQEVGIFVSNRRYIAHLISGLGDGSGRNLEQLAAYLMSCVPGFRVACRVRSRSTEYDAICSVEGHAGDFRSELGRYVVCECKDWQAPADFTTMAKFCRVLDSVKARFGVLFSKNGISGSGQTQNAEREQLKIFQDRGIVIVVINEADLASVAEGTNFVSLLRRKYEQVRLDIAGSH